MQFNRILMECIEESIQSILEEDGIVSNGLLNDVRELVNLAKDTDFGDNQSFLAKVEAIAQGRVNTMFMEGILEQIDKAGKDGKSMREVAQAMAENTPDLVAKLSNVLGPKSELQGAFLEMAESNPNFVKDVLANLSEEERAAHANLDDMLHDAIVKTVEDTCQRQLDGLINQLEEAGDSGELTDSDVACMLKQAIGLAKFMGRSKVADQLGQLLDDPLMIGAIKDDPMTRDILKKILVLRKLAGKDKKRRRKLEQLERYNSKESVSDEGSLKEFIGQSDALTKTSRFGKLKKSKSMIKKSKSVIMTAKDIPMNAFMAMKGQSGGQKDERWLQNFLSESIMEDIPWECSKALVILKQGLQVIKVRFESV